MEAVVSRLDDASEMLRSLRPELAKAALEAAGREVVSPEMIAAGTLAAREYFHRTGGNSPAVIYRAMRAVALQAQEGGAA